MNEQWQKAKQILDQLSEPNYQFSYNERHITKIMPNIMGFICDFVANKTKKGIKSWIVLFNPKDNCCYINHFNNTISDELNTFNN